MGRGGKSDIQVSKLGSLVMAEAMEEAVRKLDGLEAFKLPEGIARAAVIDERWYPDFLADLLRRGLADWRRERRESGERFA